MATIHGADAASPVKLEQGEVALVELNFAVASAYPSSSALFPLPSLPLLGEASPLGGGERSLSGPSGK